MKAHVFREYDIRGICPEELNEETVRPLGLAVGTYYREQGVSRISLGRDCRLSSPDLSRWLSAGLLETGLEVVDVGDIADVFDHVDAVATYLMGQDPKRPNYLRLCAERGFGTRDPFAVQSFLMTEQGPQLCEDLRELERLDLDVTRSSKG